MTCETLKKDIKTTNLVIVFHVVHHIKPQSTASQGPKNDPDGAPIHTHGIPTAGLYTVLNSSVPLRCFNLQFLKPQNPVRNTSSWPLLWGFLGTIDNRQSKSRAISTESPQLILPNAQPSTTSGRSTELLEKISEF
jgi:hypothetical protein